MSQRNTWMPSKKEAGTVIVLTILFLLLTAVFIGIRIDHILVVSLFIILFFTGVPTRKLAVALLPFVVFAISYDWMRIYPNYEVNPVVDVAGVYRLEKSLFGVMDNGIRLTLCEYFALHHCAVADFFAGVFYLCWVPVPMLFGVCMFFKGRRELYLRFALAFLLVNLIGFVGYYIHPTAPPWYVMDYGFEPVWGTPGNVAGLKRFDELLGVGVFDAIYGRNSNVFAAIPSLHAAYMLIALIYAIIGKCRWHVVTLFAVVTVGIWATAIYSGHHYLIDVVLGIACALVGWLIMDYALMRLPAFRRFFTVYCAYIK